MPGRRWRIWQTRGKTQALSWTEGRLWRLERPAIKLVFVVVGQCYLHRRHSQFMRRSVDELTRHHHDGLSALDLAMVTPIVYRNAARIHRDPECGEERGGLRPERCD